MMDEELRGTEETQEAMEETVIVAPESETERTEVWRQQTDSPYSPLYVPDRKQVNKNKFTLGIIIVLVSLLVICVVIAVAKVVDTAMEEASTGIATWKEIYQDFVEGLGEEAEEDRDTYDWEDWRSVPEADEEVKPDGFNWEDFEEYDEYVYGDDYTEVEEYVPNPEDEYYVELVDDIRDDLSYNVDKEEYTYYDEHMNVSIYVEYAVVSGINSVFMDEINKQLEESAMFYAREYASETVADFILYVESYVTYMDEDILSVVIDEQCYWGYEGTVDLYCLNFDMKTGVLLNNTDIIDATKELAEAFRDMSDYQNGYTEYLEELSDEEISQYLSEEDLLILFYTPVGLEIGFNYYNGWVTATIKDYEKYLQRL